jgi:hypothetical protein
MNMIAKNVCVPPKPNVEPSATAPRRLVSLDARALKRICDPITAVTMKDSTSGPTARTRRWRNASRRTVAGRLVKSQKKMSDAGLISSFRASP